MNIWKIKWENIISLLVLTIITYKDIKIIARDGFDYIVVSLEVILTILVVFGFYFIIYAARKSMLEQ